MIQLEVTSIILKQVFFKESSSEDSESSSSDEELLKIVQRSKKAKIENFVEEVVPAYTLSDFQSHFRLTREAIEELMKVISPKPIFTKPGRREIDTYTSVLLTLWTLGNQESFRGIADRFNMSKGESHTVFIRTCKKISKYVKQFIIWPMGQNAIKTVNEFNLLRGEDSFPNVIGCIDGTHIPIPGPKSDNSYYNRKGFHSILLQGVCNAKMEFIDIFCGWPGSSHDARMWQNSPLHEAIASEPHIIPENCHLLGDSAYGLTVQLMVPFKDNGHLTEAQKKFNRKLSCTRVIIEQTFGLLKGRFRRLKYLNIINLKYAKYVVITACILHNLGIKNSVSEINGVDSDDDNEPNDGGMENTQFRISKEAREKRINIMNLLSQFGCIL